MTQALCIRMIEIGKIDEVFDLSGREGVTLVPGISHDAFELPVKVGAPIKIINPDGSEVETRIIGIEMVCSEKIGRYSPIRLPSNVSKEEVQKGAFIYVGQQ